MGLLTQSLAILKAFGNAISCLPSFSDGGLTP